MSQLNPVKKSICQTFEKCNECCTIIEHHGKKRKEKRTHGGYRRSAEVKHRCGGAECNVWTHNCYIQPAEEEIRRRRSNEEIMARVEGLTNQRETLDEDDWAFKDHPVFVYADYEAMQESHGEHFPIMVCCETDEEDYTHTFYGKECS